MSTLRSVEQSQNIVSTLRSVEQSQNIVLTLSSVQQSQNIVFTLRSEQKSPVRTCLIPKFMICFLKSHILFVKYAPSKCYEQINGQMEKAVPRLMLATALKI